MKAASAPISKGVARYALTAKKNMAFLASIAERLSLAEALSPFPEAETLVQHFSAMNRVELFSGARVISASARRAIERTLSRRLKGEPLSHLLRTADFFGHKFYVNKNVLIPRPETEILVEQTLAVLNVHYNVGRGTARPAATVIPEILDLGTGSGCIAVSLTLAYPECTMTALEISKKALTVARKNSVYYKLEEKIKFVLSDLFDGVKKRSWDVIVSNPPYVPKEDIPDLSREVRREPIFALSGGRGGLEIIRRILSEAPRHLKPQGWLLMEIGLGQSGPVGELLDKFGWTREFRFAKDLNGIDRILIAKKSSQ